MTDTIEVLIRMVTIAITEIVIGIEGQINEGICAFFVHFQDRF